MKISKKLVIGLLIMLGMILVSSRVQAIWKNDVQSENTNLYCIDEDVFLPLEGHSNYSQPVYTYGRTVDPCSVRLAYIFASADWTTKAERQKAIWREFDPAYRNRENRII